MFYLTALSTLATVLFYAWLGLRVGQAPSRRMVAAPETLGDTAFDRHRLIQMNTLQWLPIQLVGLWMFAFYVSDFGAAALGIVWIAGRALYARGYLADPKARSAGFLIQFVASVLLCLGAFSYICLRILFGD